MHAGTKMQEERKELLDMLTAWKKDIARFKFASGDHGHGAMATMPARTAPAIWPAKNKKEVWLLIVYVSHP